MADKTVRVYDKLHDEYIDIRVKDNGDGTYSQEITDGSVRSIVLDSIDTNWYGTPNVTTVLVSSSSSTAVLSANANRKGLILSNLGTNNIYVRLDGGAATTSSGILIPPNSPPVVLNKGYIITNAITAIAATGATNLGVTECI